ncbi:MAG: hypothetical protein IPM92_08485 [Saprospiraceae bacterium]|nr:hypothetical protein [Saprospiraceae bacterium]
MLDYNQRIREAIQSLKVEQGQELVIVPENGHPMVDPMPVGVAETPHKKKEEKLDLSKYAELLTIKDSGDLSGKLESTPIKDIASAFGLNEKIVYQNVLFNGDKSAFDATVQKLNGMQNFEEASNYLCSEVVDAFDWMNENKMKNAQVFLKLIRRRYS